MKGLWAAPCHHAVLFVLCYTIPSYAILCYAVLCCAMLCYAIDAMLYHPMLFYAVLCYAVLGYAMLCYAVLMDVGDIIIFVVLLRHATPGCRVDMSMWLPSTHMRFSLLNHVQDTIHSTKHP